MDPPNVMDQPATPCIRYGDHDENDRRRRRGSLKKSIKNKPKDRYRLPRELTFSSVKICDFHSPVLAAFILPYLSLNYSFLGTIRYLRPRNGAPKVPPRNCLNAVVRRIYNPLGFSKAYNFILWVIFAGALLGFTLARFMYLDQRIFCPANGKMNKGGNSAVPGECYYYTQFEWYKTGIILHLTEILPASLLAVFQFTPFIRHKAIVTVVCAKPKSGYHLLY